VDCFVGTESPAIRLCKAFSSIYCLSLDYLVKVINYLFIEPSVNCQRKLATTTIGFILDGLNHLK